MSVEEQQNNPLHGLKSETMITELVEFYGWELLYAALGLNCFRINQSIAGCVKSLKKTQWVQYRVENFYLSRFKQMPKARGDDFDLPPRERGFANGIVPREPMRLTLEKIAAMQDEADRRWRSRARY
jgi:uncharacterized protein (DUF2132 family)